MLDASKPDAAVRAFSRAQREVASCVTRQHLVTPYSIGIPGELQSLRFMPDSAPLRSTSGGPSGLLLDVLQQFAVVEGGVRLWRVEPRTYEFRLLDYLERELLVYHWQPGPGLRGPDHPHVHVSAALRAQTNAVTTRNYDLDKLHLPTSYVSLAMVVCMLIEEFGIAPLRPDWQQVLEHAEQFSTIA